LTDPLRPIREPAVAGTFYPEDPDELAALVDGLLDAAESHLEADRELKALVCPHAGLRFSGAVAAETFACLKKRQISTVVLVGPDHYIGFEGIAVYPAGAFKTPLGEVWVDEELSNLFLEAGAGVRAAPEAHSREHALEVQLPFLQRVLPEANIVPVLMGFRSRSNVEVLANVLSRALDNPRVILLATTDLSHYHPREVARKLDSRITDLVRAFAPPSLWEELKNGRVEACGGDPLVSVMLGAGIAGAELSRILRYGDSADSGGSDQSVVGYLSAAFFRGMPPSKVQFEAHAKELVPEEAETLLNLAHQSAATPPGSAFPVMELRMISQAMRNPGRAFVTLKHGTELRGCVGYMDATLPLWEVVARSARAAAHDDSRFSPVEPDEMAEITVEVSVLTEPREVASPEDVVVGRHGVILSHEGRQGVLLPQTAIEHGWNREALLSYACRKAGLSVHAWKQGAQIQVFEAQVFQAEPGPTAINGGS
jgi:AmmeMemoRadiSam system protein B/AmmeMemoRadiSam system protein A